MKKEWGEGKSSIPRYGRALSMVQLLWTEEASFTASGEQPGINPQLLAPVRNFSTSSVCSQGWLGFSRRCRSATP